MFELGLEAVRASAQQLEQRRGARLLHASVRGASFLPGGRQILERLFSARSRSASEPAAGRWKFQRRWDWSGVRNQRLHDYSTIALQVSPDLPEVTPL